MNEHKKPCTVCGQMHTSSIHVCPRCMCRPGPVEIERDGLRYKVEELESRIKELESADRKPASALETIAENTKLRDLLGRTLLVLNHALNRSANGFLFTIDEEEVQRAKDFISEINKALHS